MKTTDEPPGVSWRGGPRSFGPLPRTATSKVCGRCSPMTRRSSWRPVLSGARPRTRRVMQTVALNATHDPRFMLAAALRGFEGARPRFTSEAAADVLQKMSSHSYRRLCDRGNRES
jgi:hypothetical protein